MNMPLSSAVVIDLEQQRWLLQDNDLQRLAHDERVVGAQIHFTDFAGAIQGVEQVSAARRHTAPIIEKNLRDRGEAESTSEVFLLDTRSHSRSTRALYCAVPSDTFEQYRDMAGQHDDHLLLVPHLSLLLKRGKAVGEPVVCVLFQHGLYIDLLLMVDGNAHACLRVTASGSTEIEWQRALRYLIEEIDTLRNRLDQPVHSAVCINWDPEGLADIDQLCDWLEEHGGLAVTRETQCELNVDGQTISSSLPSLLPLFNGSMAVNTVPALPLYWAERYLPVAAVLIAGVGLALFALAWQWQSQTSVYETQFRELLDSSQQVDLPGVRASLQEATANAVSPADISFVRQTWRASNRPSLAAVLADIREILPANVYLSSVAFGDRRNSEAFRLEGWIEADMAAVNSIMEQVIRDLSARGYGVQANNLRGYMRRNLFQLELGLDGVNREI